MTSEGGQFVLDQLRAIFDKDYTTNKEMPKETLELMQDLLGFKVHSTEDAAQKLMRLVALVHPERIEDEWPQSLLHAACEMLHTDGQKYALIKSQQEHIDKQNDFIDRLQADYKQSAHSIGK